jgi:ABC-type phosphate/phosphonate transport system ATPase subunit
VLELLGVGVPRSDGGWLLHRVCARFDRSGLVLVVSSRPEERKALFDVISARAIANEGRIWVDGVPAMRGTTSRIRHLVGDVELPPLLVPHRSIFWNVLAQGTSRLRLLRPLQQLPSLARREAAIRTLRLVDLDARLGEPASTADPETAMRVSLARTLLPEPRYVLIREPDQTLYGEALNRFLAQVAQVARLQRSTMLVSVSSPDVAPLEVAGRVLALAEGLLIFDGAPAAFGGFERWSSGSAAARPLR